MEPMDLKETSASKKALNINLDDTRYGTFAEIGAGQEVVRYFFQAGRASHTIAKTISAYDMTFSDEIYGKAGRYVSEKRLITMLDHEYRLLHERLAHTRGDKTCFFVFANTVTTSSDSDRCHGWVGVRFQTRPRGPMNDIVLHVRLLDRFRLQQTEALGILGVNLLYAALYHGSDGTSVIRSLAHNLSSKRIEVDMIRFTGDDLAHIDNRLMSLELVLQNLSEAVLFGPSGEVCQASDALFKKPVMVQRGTFRPVTKVNVEILKRGLDHMRLDLKASGDASAEPTALFEISMHDESNTSDFLDRVDTLSALKQMVLVSKFFLFYQLKCYLRMHTDQAIGLVVGASHLDKLFAPAFYQNLPGQFLEGISRLFDDHTKLYVFPFKSELLCLTADTFNPSAPFHHLYRFLVEKKHVVDIANCDEVDTSIHSEQVRELLAQKNSQWEQFVPEPVRDRIKTRRLFGFRGDQ